LFAIGSTLGSGSPANGESDFLLNLFVGAVIGALGGSALAFRLVAHRWPRWMWWWQDVGSPWL